MTDFRAITYPMLAAASEEFQREMCAEGISKERAAILARGVAECEIYKRVLTDLQDDEIETKRLRREHAEMMDQQEEWDRANYGDAA